MENIAHPLAEVIEMQRLKLLTLQFLANPLMRASNMSHAFNIETHLEELK